MGKIKSILVALVLFSVPAIFNLAAQAAGSFGLESVAVLDKSTNVVADTPTVSGNTVTSTIVFHELNDYVKYNLALKNSTTTSYKIIDITDNNSNILIDYTYDNHADEVINAGGSLNLELTITYVQTHQDANDRTQNNNVKFAISYLDLHTGTIEDDEIILVPNTGENTKEIVSTNFIPGIVTFAIIFAGVVLVAAILYKKKGIAVISVLAIVFTATGALNMGAVAEDYIDLNADLNSEIRLRDYFAGIVRYKDDYTGDDISVNLADIDELIPYDADDPWLFSDIFMGAPLSFFTAPGGLVGVGVQFTGTNIAVNLDDPIMDDFDITIVYGEQSYGITYDYNGGTVATANPTVVKGSDAPFTLNTPTKDGSTFFCWTGTDISGCEQEYTVDPSNVSSDLEYTANYVHEITILDQNGTKLGYTVVQEAHDETAYSSDTFYTDGYHISGGSCTNNQHLGIYNNGSVYIVEHVNHNTVCTVTTVPNTYSVELVVNNGYGSDTKTVTHGDNVSFSDVTPNGGYNFNPNITCTNGQSATLTNDTVTVSNVTDYTVCTVDIMPQTLHDITYMQQMTSDICYNTNTPNVDATKFDLDGSHYLDSTYIPRKNLVDSRDGKTYQVTKLADARCWMTQNLALGSNDEETALTPDDTDISQNYTLVKGDITKFTSANKSTVAFYLDSTAGGFYTNNVALANSAYQAYESICPKGWKIAAFRTGTNINDLGWGSLFSTYGIKSDDNSSLRLLEEPFNFIAAGYAHNGSIVNSDSSGHSTILLAQSNWSGNDHNEPLAIKYGNTGKIETAWLYGGQGGNIRCVAR